MSVVDFNASSLSNNQLCSHSIVIPSLVFLVGVEVRMVAAFNPHMKASIVSPALSHQLSCCQELLYIPLVNVKHEE